MPTDQGVDAARAWLLQNRRAPHRPRNSGPAVSAHLPQENAPTAGVAPARAIPAGVSEKPAIAEIVPGSTPDELFLAFDQIERLARQQLNAALEKDPGGAQSILRVHKDAARNLLDARVIYLAAAERERKLLPGAWVRRQMAEHDSILANEIRAMPRRLAARVADQPIDQVERELSIWSDQFLKTLHATNGNEP
jgi:hypothetical protein